jgi:hypothetical protein
LLKETYGSDIRVIEKVHSDPTGWLGKQVKLTMAMDHVLTEATWEIEELHMRYDEQEQVIKDRDDLIAELLAEVDSEHDSDTDFGPDYDGDDDGGAADDTKENPKVVPKGNAPQEKLPQPESVLEEVP